ncbi:MAG: hypothetical protein ACLTDR_07350 [Adlercreutzia equolifaciens]
MGFLDNVTSAVNRSDGGRGARRRQDQAERPHRRAEPPQQGPGPPSWGRACTRPRQGTRRDAKME